MQDCSRRKQYVEVLVRHGIDGTVQPKTIVMANGPSYKIDRVKGISRAKTPHPGEAVLRYTILIGSHETYLYEDNGRFYVEIKEH